MASAPAAVVLDRGGILIVNLAQVLEVGGLEFTGGLGAPLRDLGEELIPREILEGLQFLPGGLDVHLRLESAEHADAGFVVFPDKCRKLGGILLGDATTFIIG